jgi:hypothetical protein
VHTHTAVGMWGMGKAKIDAEAHNSNNRLNKISSRFIHRPRRVEQSREISSFVRTGFCEAPFSRTLLSSTCGGVYSLVLLDFPAPGTVVDAGETPVMITANCTPNMTSITGHISAISLTMYPYPRRRSCPGIDMTEKQCRGIIE